MTKRTNLVFTGLTIVAWLIFVALCIEAGALIVNFVFSLFKPSVVGHLYQKLDLSEVYERSKMVYFGIYSFILFISVMKAYLFYVVIRLLMKFDMSRPFSSYVARQITNICYITFSIGLISYISREISRNMVYHGVEIDKLNQFWADSSAYITMAAVIYVIASIFSRGIELQNENDLTV